MATALELAQSREQRKLRQAGLDADGNPLKPNGNGDDGGDDDEGGGTGNDDGGEKPTELEVLQQELATLKRELIAANGRAAPEQQRAAEYQTLWQKAEAARLQREQELNTQIEALRAQLESVNNTIDVNELLTEEERAAIDPNILNSVVKLADKIAQRRAPKVDVRSETLRVLDEREAQKVQKHLNQVLNDPARGLHQISTLMTDPDFLTWMKEEDNDIESVVNSLVAAKTTEDVDRYAKIVSKRIVKFKERTKQQVDPKLALAQHMRRGEKPKLTPEQFQAKMNEAKQLARSRDPADRLKSKQLLNSLD